MAADSALNVLRSLQHQPRLAAVYLISGQQAFLREFVLDSIRAAMPKEQYDHRRFLVGAGDDFAAAIDAVCSPTLFAPKSLVVCRVLKSRRDRADEDGDEQPSGRSSRSAADETALAAAIPDMRGPSRLVLLYERDTAPAKVRRAVEQHGAAVNCMRPFDNQLAQYAAIFAAAAGLRLAAPAIDWLVETFGADLAAMSNAVAKAATQHASGGTLDAQDLKEPTTGRIPEIFEIAECVTQGQATRALALLERAMALGRDPFEILAVEIVPALRRMAAAASMLERRRSAFDIAQAMGLPPSSRLVGSAIEGARRHGFARLKTAYEKASRLDADFKMGVIQRREHAIGNLLIDLLAMRAS